MFRTLCLVVICASACVGDEPKKKPPTVQERLLVAIDGSDPNELLGAYSEACTAAAMGEKINGLPIARARILDRYVGHDYSPGVTLPREYGDPNSGTVNVASRDADRPLNAAFRALWVAGAAPAGTPVAFEAWVMAIVQVGDEKYASAVVHPRRPHKKEGPPLFIKIPNGEMWGQSLPHKLIGRIADNEQSAKIGGFVVVALPEPSQATTAAPTEKPAPAGPLVIWGGKGYGSYHLPDCVDVARLPKAREKMRKSEADDKGLKPCPKCKPQ